MATRLGHVKDCASKSSQLGDHYCPCFVSEYLADKVAAPEQNDWALSTDVFDIPELREHILSFLPMSDIARMDRMSKTWRWSVQSSAQLQRELFLLPAGPVAMPVPDGGKHVPTYDIPMALNPRLGLDVEYHSHPLH